MESAERFAAGLSASAWDEKTRFAIQYSFIKIGEALRYVPDDVRARHPDIPWQAMVGMRNRVAHDYLRLDAEVMSRTVAEEFPRLRPLLERVRDAEAG